MQRALLQLFLAIALFTILCRGASAARDGDKGFDVVPASASKYAVLVGVNDYEKCSDLRYCKADVTALREQLVKIGFDRRDIAVLTDGEAIRPSRRNILEQLDVTLRVADETDLIIVALSGHGAKIGGKSYFCPLDARADDPEGTMIAVEELYDKLEKCPARLKIVLVDACRNKFLPVDSRPLAEQDKSIDGFAKSLTDGVFPKGVALLTSCTSGERSWEDSDFGHGVFMHFVLQGLSGKADQIGADGKKDKWVSLFELCDYVRSETKSHVLRTRRVTQRPHHHTSLDLPDFRIWPYPEAEPPQEFTNSIDMKLKLIPAGEFTMGSSESEEDRSDDEKQHRVRVTKPYYLGAHEVTQKEFSMVMGFNPSDHQRGGDREDEVSGLDTSGFPVEHVSWYDAVHFCNKLSELEGRTPCYRLTDIERYDDDGRGIKSATVSRQSGNGYRLPAEAEWEYACRAGTKTSFSFGSVLNGKQANCRGDYPYGTETKGPDLGRTTTVGSYSANAWGLYDMHGNVWEWCDDWYDEDYYEDSPVDDPTGPTTGASRAARVFRGGGWLSYARHCRSADRFRNAPGFRFYDLGFRIALVPSE